MFKKILFIFLFFQAALLYCQEKNDSARYYYFFNTDPYNAEVFQSDSSFGFTPVRFFSNEKLEGNLLFKKENYFDKTFELKDYDFNKGLSLVLMPMDSKDNKIVFSNKETQFKTKRNFYIIGGFGIGALTSVLATIKFKNIANKSYDNYLNTLNQSELDNSNRYDVYSTITLIAMEAAIAGLIYYLFIDK